jgi:hypothetical protein
MFGLGRGNLLLAAFWAGEKNSDNDWPFILTISKTMKTAAAERIQVLFTYVN